MIEAHCTLRKKGLGGNHLRREIDEMHGPVEFMIELLRVIELQPVLHTLCEES
jgi:hypothetical protein